jgi:hypothetical protein
MTVYIVHPVIVQMIFRSVAIVLNFQIQILMKNEIGLCVQMSSVANHIVEMVDVRMMEI